MAKVNAEISVKIDALGKWQKPIEDAVRSHFRGAKPSYVPLPNGHVGLVVSWSGFRGHDVAERQAMVRGAIADLGPTAARRISMIVALTPREMAGAEDG
jgi:hypothetical protein